MNVLVSILYLASVVLLVLAALPKRRSKLNLGLLGAAAFVLAYSLPTIVSAG